MRVIQCFILALILVSGNSWASSEDDRQQYIVRYHQATPLPVKSKQFKAYRQLSVINGFTAELTKAQVSRLKSDAKVKSVEVNRTIELTPQPIRQSFNKRSVSTWGLDRLDQAQLPLDGQYSPSVDGVSIDGAGVNVYVLDTGIRLSHNEFSGRAQAAFVASSINEANDDLNGHGTHMAATVGGASFGVANQVNLHSVKVLDAQGRGTVAGLLEGIDYVTNHHLKPAVAVIGVDTAFSTAVNDAIEAAITAGVVVVVASGDDNRDSCDYSPSASSLALTVAASSEDDKASASSNRGSCVDLYAPGLYIKSAWHLGDHFNNTISHSPVAAAHVAGIAAQIRGVDDSCDVTQVNDYVRSYARQGVLTEVADNTNNRLAAALGGSGEGMTLPNCTPEVATRVVSYNMAKCQYVNGKSSIDEALRYSHGRVAVLDDSEQNIQFACLIDFLSSKRFIKAEIDASSVPAEHMPVCRLEIDYSPGGGDYVDFAAVNSELLQITDPDVQYNGNGYARTVLLRCWSAYFADESYFNGLRIFYEQ